MDAVPSERHVRVEVDGEVVAESRRPHALFETLDVTNMERLDAGEHFVR